MEGLYVHISFTWQSTGLFKNTCWLIGCHYYYWLCVWESVEGLCGNMTPTQPTIITTTIQLYTPHQQHQWVEHTTWHFRVAVGSVIGFECVHSTEWVVFSLNPMTRAFLPFTPISAYWIPLTPVLVITLNHCTSSYGEIYHLCVIKHKYFSVCEACLLWTWCVTHSTSHHTWGNNVIISMPESSRSRWTRSPWLCLNANAHGNSKSVKCDYTQQLVGKCEFHRNDNM